jgi:hypothetical protein
MTEYKCSACGKKVAVDSGVIVARSCDCHPDTGVVAECSATLRGKAAVCQDAGV